ncbi:MAG: cache domain-containing protein, partial [Proteobacteria bacterium]|nr:cache domain-containing protein [Pseudomonadota bacterium]
MNIHFDRARLALLLLLAALLGVGMWAYRGVGDSLREIRATGMQTLLNTQVGTLEQWISERLHEAEQQAAEPELRAGIVKLAIGSGADPARIIEDILRKTEAIGVTAALVVDLKGKVLAASDHERVGRNVTADFFTHLSPVLAGRPAFVRPYRGTGGAASAGKMGRSWVAAPIRAANGKIVALLALGSKVDEGFSDLFKAARPGLTGESLVFVADGWLLSESRHADELQRRDLAPRLALPNAEADVLTLLSAQAVAKRAEGGEGVLLQPYPNYLGREVIGAWRWLRDRDIGVAIEMEAGEA